MSLVLVDTCIWVPLFNRPQSAEKRVFDELLDADRAALVGPIIAEILRGFQLDAQANYVASLLHGVRYLQTTRDDWERTAQLGRRLAASANRLSLSDLVIAAVAERIDAEVYSSDPHCDLFSSLKRYAS